MSAKTNYSDNCFNEVELYESVLPFVSHKLACRAHEKEWRVTRKNRENFYYKRVSVIRRNRVKEHSKES